MKWNIVADSSCDLKQRDVACDGFGFATVPFTIRVGETEYEDSENLDTLHLLDAMEGCAQLGSTACPPPHTWVEEF